MRKFQRNDALVDKAAVLAAARELRNVLCREARYMVIRGDLDRATDHALSAIEEAGNGRGKVEAKLKDR